MKYTPDKMITYQAPKAINNYAANYVMPKINPAYNVIDKFSNVVLGEKPSVGQYLVKK